MTLPLKIGAALGFRDIAAHRDWLFDGARDIELTDLMSHAALTGNWRETVAEARIALDGHAGRLGIHGPFRGLDIDTPDPEVQAIVTARFLTAVEAADAVGARQMVIHSPYDRWFHQNWPMLPDYRERKIGQVRDVLGPVLTRAEALGVTLVVENIQDVDPFERLRLIEALGSPALALSIDTGHAHLARYMSGAPPVDYFVRAAGERLAHVHIQDLDGHADRHWAPGEGSIEWRAVFAALADCTCEPHLVLELRNKADIPRGFDWLKGLGLAR